MMYVYIYMYIIYIYTIYNCNLRVPTGQLFAPQKKKSKTAAFSAACGSFLRMIWAVEVIVQWKFYRKTPYLMGNSTVSSVDFPLKKQSIESSVT